MSAPEAEVTVNAELLQELQDSVARANAMFRSAVDGIITVDERGVIESLNPAAGRMFGYAPDELIGKNVKLLASGEHGRVHDECIERYLQTGERRIIGAGREVEGLRKDGTTFPLHLSVSEWLLGNRRMFTGMCHDLTEAKRSQAWAQAIHETAVDAIVTIDERGVISSVNPAAVALFGYAPDELVGSNVSLLMPEPHAAQHDGYIARFVETGQARVIGKGREVEGRRKDGTVFPLCLSISEWSVGSTRMFTGICHDLTDQKRAAAKLTHATKLASLGEMAGKVAHEINNPISIIVLKARLRLTDATEELPPKAKRDLERIVTHCDRLVDLCRSLLDYCRPVSSAKHPLDANAPLRRALGLAEEKARRHRTELVEELGTSLPLVVGNRDELEQVFLNLCINAIDAVSQGDVGSTVTVSSRNGAQLPDGRSAVVVTVRDDGPGIDPEVADRLFEPFVTTKGKKGTGLGLAVSHGIVQDHGGEIRTESEPGHGTAFHVMLPAAPSGG